MANFTFVTHKGARPEKSGLVKAHVMRESQRKRKEARQRHNQQLSARLVSLDDGLALENAPSRSSLSHRSFAVSAVSEDCPVGYTTKPDDSSTSASLAWPSSGNFFDPDHTTEQADRIPADWSDTWQSGVLDEGHYSSDSDVNLSLRDTCGGLAQQPFLPYPTLQGDPEPLDSPLISQGLFGRVQELVSHYTSSLYIERPGLPSVNPLHYWQGQALISPKILLSTALFYCAYRDARRGLVSYDRDHEYFKDRSLYWINRALENADTAVTDDNIATIVSMCMYENVRGSNLVPTHLHGIRQMLDIRGGINNFPSAQGHFISEMAILQDMMHASCSNVPPTMFEITGPILRDVRLNNNEKWYPQSPLRVLNDAGFVRPIAELQSSFGMLKDAFDAFEMLCIEAFDSETASKEAESFKLRREKFWARMRIEDNNVSGEVPLTTEAKVEKAVLLAARIHLRAVAMKIQHDDDVNAVDMKRLYTVVREIDLKFWKVAHYVYLWILLIGGAAANQYPHHRSHFVSEILRLGLGIGLFDWQSFKQTVGNFLWLQQFLRRSVPSH